MDTDSGVAPEVRVMQEDETIRWAYVRDNADSASLGERAGIERRVTKRRGRFGSHDFGEGGAMPQDLLHIGWYIGFPMMAQAQRCGLAVFRQVCEWSLECNAASGFLNSYLLTILLLKPYTVFLSSLICTLIRLSFGVNSELT